MCGGGTLGVEGGEGQGRTGKLVPADASWEGETSLAGPACRGAGGEAERARQGKANMRGSIA